MDKTFKFQGDNAGFTPIHIAAFGNQVEIFKYIMAKLENKNPRNRFGVTPLHMVAEYGYFEICKHILENVEDRNPVNRFGFTPLDLAKQNKEYKIIGLFNAYNE